MTSISRFTREDLREKFEENKSYLVDKYLNSPENDPVFEDFLDIVDPYEILPVMQEFDPINPNNAKALVLFNSRHTTRTPFWMRAFSIYSYLLAEENIASFFTYRYLILDFIYPDLNLDGKQTSNILQSKNWFFHHYDFENATPEEITEYNPEKEILRFSTYPEVNLYGPLISRLRKSYRKYSFPDPKENYNDNFVDFRKTVEMCFDFFERMNFFVEKTDKPVYMIGWDINYPPDNIFWPLSESKYASKKLNYLTMTPTYSQYFTGSKKDYASELTALNLTIRGMSSRSPAGKREQFFEFLQNTTNNKEKLASILAEVHEYFDDNFLDYSIPNDILMNQDKLKSWKSGINEMEEKINEFDQEGRKIFVLFGQTMAEAKMEKADKSKDFGNMVDWIRNTIEYFHDRNDVLLLRPHPNEHHGKYNQRELHEFLEDHVTSDDLEHDNIILMESRRYPLKSLYQTIDAGLIWRSSVGQELLGLKIPVIACGNGTYFHCIDIKHPDTYEEYKELINNVEALEVTEEQSLMAKLYLYWRNQHAGELFPYIKGVDYTVDGEEFREALEWNQEELDRLFAEGTNNQQEVLRDNLFYEMNLTKEDLRL